MATRYKLPPIPPIRPAKPMQVYVASIYSAEDPDESGVLGVYSNRDVAIAAIANKADELREGTTWGLDADEDGAVVILTSYAEDEEGDAIYELFVKEHTLNQPAVEG